MPPSRCILAGRQALQHEIAIDDISGVEFKKNYRFTPLDAIFAFMIVALGVALMGSFFAAVYASMEAIAILLGVIVGAALTLPLFMIKTFRPYIKLLSFSGAIGSFSPLLGWLMTAGKPGVVLAFVLFVVLVAVLIIRIFKVVLQPNLAIIIRTRSGIGAVTIRHTPLFTPFDGNNIVNFTGFEEVLPGRNTELAIKELGAIIHDVQTMGDKAIEKWSE